MITKPVVALVVGHKQASQGASNKQHGITEYRYNKKLANLIKPKVTHASVKIVTRDDTTYRKLPNKINELNPDFVVSLHCNAFNGMASGTEILYWHKSTKGKNLASYIYRELVTTLRLPERGLKPRDVEQRGGYLLRYTRAPAIICEPFFIDRNLDLNVGENYAAVAAAYARGIDKYAQIIPWYAEKLKDEKLANEAMVRNERKVQDSKMDSNSSCDIAGKHFSGS